MKPGPPLAFTRSVAACITVLAAACSSPSDGNEADSREGRVSQATLMRAAALEVERAGKPAFEGAMGHGALTQGGRGGKVMVVTTLTDGGPGSLRACIDVEGPRVCVFQVAGTIRFFDKPPVIRNPFITIAGQTAPGGGITLAHSGGKNGLTPLLIKNTHDVIIRHIRVRNDRIGEERGSEDGITIENSAFVILDHVSASWARDELFNGYGDNDHITVSNSIFAWGIPRHDKCALLASDPKGPQNVSFVGNLCVHNGDRNPDINFPPKSCVEVVNNVFYNAQSEFAEIWESHGGSPVSLVGNVFKAGPNTPASAIGVVRQTIGSRGPSVIYLQDNLFEGDFNHIGQSAAALQVTQPTCPLTISPVAAAEAYQGVLRNSGAAPRDAIDEMAVEDVRRGTGRIVHEPGTIPVADAGRSYPDWDEDGMSDDWERANGLDAANSDPWGDADNDGAFNLDEFLDHLADDLER